MVELGSCLDLLNIFSFVFHNNSDMYKLCVPEIMLLQSPLPLTKWDVPDIFQLSLNGCNLGALHIGDWKVPAEHLN